MDVLWTAALVISLLIIMALSVQFFTGCGFWATPVATEQPGPKVNWAHVREMELDLEGMVFHDLEGNLLVEPLTRAELESVARLARMERGVEQGMVSRDRYRAEKARVNVVQPRAVVHLGKWMDDQGSERARAAEIRQQGMDELAEDDLRPTTDFTPHSYGLEEITPMDIANMPHLEFQELRRKMGMDTCTGRGIFG